MWMRRWLTFFKICFFAGRQANDGEQTLAGLMHHFPEFGRCGARKLPRSWRALKGWRKLCPARSRKPQPWGLWCAVANFMIQQGCLAMAVMTLVMVSAYLRPGEAMGLRRSSLVPPARQISATWSLLICPEEKPQRTKTGASDDSIALDTPWLAWLDPVLKALRGAGDSSSIWPFSYPEYLHKFKEAQVRLGLSGIVPYQARHSGPSIDRACKARTQEEVRKRGRWQSHRSLVRYEKHARLGAVHHSLSPLQQQHFSECERLIEAVVLGRSPPVVAAARIQT